MVKRVSFDDIWALDFWEKNLISVLIFVVISIPIYLLMNFLNSGYPLFLLFLPLILTSSFYFKKINIFPPILATLSIFLLSILYYEEMFFDILSVSIINTAIFFLLFLIVSILIGNVNITLKKLKEEIKKKDDLRQKKKFLNTLLRQDLRSRYQNLTGYLQIIDENIKLEKEEQKYLDKALSIGERVNETIELAKELRKLEESERTDQKDVIKIIDEVVHDISDITQKEDISIEFDSPEEISKVKGNYSLKLMFSHLFKTRIYKGSCDKITIDIKELENKVKINIDDNGDMLSEQVENLFSGRLYTGETTGKGGVKYYLIKRIADKNSAQIEIKRSELGGTIFMIYLKKMS